MDKKKVEKNEKAKKTRTIILVVALVIVLGGIYYYFFLGPSLQFQKMEKEFLKVGQRYVEQNAYLSPKEGNIKDFTLQTFYDADYLEEPFYIPNSKKLWSFSFNIRPRGTTNSFEWTRNGDCFPW